MLKRTAERIMELLKEMPEVKKCELYGSLADGSYDELSDIDINIDVSGCDNGLFMLTLAKRLGEKLSIYYYDYAPSLVPEKYIVSIAINEDHPTEVVDLCCDAEPHCITVTKQRVRRENNEFSHILKLWTANFKHFVRNRECHGDILRMAGRIGLADIESKGDCVILKETLEWLEVNSPVKLDRFVESCQRLFREWI